MRFVTLEKDGKQVLGLLDAGKKVAADVLSLKLGRDYLDMNDLLERVTPEDIAAMKELSKGEGFARGTTYELSQCKLLSPIPRPRHDIICLGLNYSEHAAESGEEVPEVPVFFSKRAAMTTGHMGTVQGHLDVDECVDYEVELAVVIGKRAKYVQASQAQDYIFGYTVLNDFSSRTLQMGHKQWYLGKSTDTFTAMGPWIITADQVPFPLELDLCSRVNGEVRQSSNTRLFIHNIPNVLELLTRTITLEPGDIISTGTPSGVGMGMSPPHYLKKGDIVECEVQGVGTLCNRIG